MNCKKCGSPLLENDMFCKNCGASVEKENAQPAVSQAPVYGQPDQSSVAQYGVAPQVANNFNATPTPVVEAPKKNNNTAIIVVGVIIAVAIFAGILTGMLLLNKDKGGSKKEDTPPVVNTDDPDDPDKPVQPTQTNSNYTVKAKGFTFKVPDYLIYQQDDESLSLMDEDETWLAAIFPTEGSYSQIVKQKSALKSNFEAAGYEVANMEEKTIDGDKYLLLEIDAGGEMILVGYTAANSMYVFAIEIYDINNEINYDVLDEVAPILSSSEYNGDSHSINSSVDLDLGKMLEGIEE